MKPPRTWQGVDGKIGQYEFMGFTALRVGEDVALFRDGMGLIGTFPDLDDAEAKAIEMMRTGEGEAEANEGLI